MEITKENYEKQLDGFTEYAVEHITKICDEIGPRESGSKQEREAQKYWAKELEKFSDSVEIEDFDVHPHAFMAWVVIDATLMLLSFVFYFALKLPIVSFAMAAVSAACMIGEFLFYKQFLDPLFKKQVSCNVVARREPVGEVKQRIIFSGHCDSAWEWWYTYIGGHIALKTVCYGSIIGLIYIIIVNIVTLITSGMKAVPTQGVAAVLGWSQLVFVPFFIALYFLCNWKRIVPGANDNLTGCAAAVAVMKYLSDNDIRFENTEVIAVTTGCEEAGLRGANAYTKRHLKELNETTSVFFGMDTLTDYDDMAIYIKDMTGTVNNDPRVCALIKAGGKKAGLDLPYEKVYFGASDAAAVSKLGVPAATLAAMDPAPPRYYHTRLDTPEALKPETFRACLDACIQTVFIFDEQGLKKEYE